LAEVGADLARWLVRFPDETAAIDHLAAIRWKDGPVCPLCGSRRKIYRSSNRQRFSCGDCQSQFSIKVGLIFEGTKIPLRTWFAVIWLATTLETGVNAADIKSAFGIGRTVGRSLLNRLYHAANTVSFAAALDESGEAGAPIPMTFDVPKGRRGKALSLKMSFDEALARFSATIPAEMNTLIWLAG